MKLVTSWISWKLNPLLYIRWTSFFLCQYILWIKIRKKYHICSYNIFLFLFVEYVDKVLQNKGNGTPYILKDIMNSPWNKLRVWLNDNI